MPEAATNHPERVIRRYTRWRSVEPRYSSKMQQNLPMPDAFFQIWSRFPQPRERSRQPPASAAERVSFVSIFSIAQPRLRAARLFSAGAIHGERCCLMPCDMPRRYFDMRHRVCRATCRF